MSCDGHYAHHFESTADCRNCGHERFEHDENGFWADNRGAALAPEQEDPITAAKGWQEAELREAFGR